MCMNDNEKKLINNFFQSVEALHKSKIIRSDKVLGDFAEWLCVKKYGLVLATSGRNVGFDGLIGKLKVQVKAHNSPKGTNLSVGNPDKYDMVYVIIGKNSCLRDVSKGDGIHIYKFTSADVNNKMKRKKGFYCAKKILKATSCDVVLC